MRIILIVLFCASFLFAHKLNIFMSQENEKVYISAYFASGSFCKECKIKFLNKNKVLIKEGITNDKGEFIIDKLSLFDSPIYVEVEALGGHKVQNNFEIKVMNSEKITNKEYKILIEENKKLKREIELLKEKNNFAEIFKMFVALLVMAGIFIVLKKSKKVKNEGVENE